MKNHLLVEPTTGIEIPIIGQRYECIAEQIKMQGSNVILFDGMPGKYWDDFAKRILQCFPGKKVSAIKFDPCVADNSDLSRSLNSVKGYKEFFNEADLISLKQKIKTDSQAFDYVFIYGTGSSLLSETGCVFWMNISKEGIHTLAKEHELEIFNQKIEDEAFTNFWIVSLRTHLQLLVERIKFYCDMNDLSEPVLIDFQVLKEKIGILSKQPFQTKEIYSSSIWGGQWLLKHIYKNSPLKNVAWSYKFLPSESDVIFQGRERTLEIPFDLIMMLESEALLGKELAKKTGNEFPIRINITDTINGDVLSCQVHPTFEYSEEKFSRPYNEFETYFILNTKNDSRIHLGLKSGVTSQDFKNEIDRAIQTKKKIKIDEFVNSWKAEKESLFSVLPGSVHFIGKNNLVIEIMTSSIIHTFRFYDYQRVDKNGAPRKLDIEDAFNTLNEKIDTDFVEAYLKTEKVQEKDNNGYREYSYHIPQNVPAKFTLQEIAVESSVDIKKDCYHLLTLVEGTSINIQQKDQCYRLGYLETILIPACINSYQIENDSSTVAKILQVAP